MPKKTLFDKLYGAGEAVVQAMQKPFRIKLVKRVAEKFQDKVEDLKITKANELSDLRHRLVNTKNEDEAYTVYTQIADIRREIAEAEALAEAAFAEQTELFSEVDEDDI